MHTGRLSTSWLIGALISSMMLLGCSSSSGDATPATVAPTGPGPVVVGLRAGAELLADRWGDEGAFLVVLAALDLGYVVDQISAAIEAGLLGSDGSVVGVEPAGEPSGRLSPLVTGLRRMATASEDIPEDAFIASINKSASEVFAAGRRQIDSQQVEELMVGILLHLAARGYSPEQIVTGIVFGQITLEAPTLGCWFLTEGGQPVVAARIQLPGLPCPPPGSFWGAPTKTSLAQAVAGGSLDGEYVGGITNWPNGWNVHSSTVLATVIGTEVTLEVEYVASIPFRHTEGVLVCTLVVDVLAAGSGELGNEFTLTVESAGVLDASGSECGDTFPWPRTAPDEFVGSTGGATFPVEARVEEDALLGRVVLPFLEFEAVRG